MRPTKKFRDKRAVPRVLDSRVSSVLEIVRGGTSSDKNLRFHRSIMTSKSFRIISCLPPRRAAPEPHLLRRVDIFFSFPFSPPSFPEMPLKTPMLITYVTQP